MSREEYIKLRNENNAAYLYEYYKDHFDEKKHKQFLEPSLFFDYIKLWPGTPEAISNVTHYYDAHFGVLSVPNKQGQYFMYI